MHKYILVIFLIGLSAAKANAQTDGMCGDSLTWSLTGTKSDLTLTISGTGSMYNYRNNPPWRSKRRIIKALILHDGITSIGDYAFGVCVGVTSVTIPNTVETIGNYAFSWTSLNSITIPNSVKSIGDCAFWACPCLTSITIPSSVTTIGKDVFYYSNNIKDIYVSWTTLPPTLKRNIVDFLANIKDIKKVTLHIPQGTLALYESSGMWKNFNLVEDVIDME